MAIPVGWSNWSDDEKYEYTLAFVRGRMDAAKAKSKAKPECRKTPLTNKSGKITKPATVPCGSGCRQPKNCKVTKGELRTIRRRMRGASKQELAEAVKAAIAAKKGGKSSTGAVYEATKKALGQQGRERLERKKQKAKNRDKPPVAPAEIVLGKPIYDRVDTPQKAIENGRAILGDLIERLRAEEFPRGEGLSGKRQAVGSKIFELRGELITEERENGNSPKAQLLQEKIRELKAERDSYHSVESYIKYGTAKEIASRRKTASESLDAVKNIDSGGHEDVEGEKQRQISQFEQEIRDLDTAYSSVKAEEDNFIGTQIIQSLMDASSISADRAMELADSIQIKGKKHPPEIRQDIADFIRLTNGQAMETLSSVSRTTGRAKASKFSGTATYRDKTSLFHELGHHVEYAQHNASALVGRDWVKSRATGRVTPLKRLLPNSGYGRDERAMPDHFIDPYVGKVYVDGNSEVISMGVEVFSDPQKLARLAKADPEHLALVVGVMQQQFNPSSATAATALKDDAARDKRDKDYIKKLTKQNPPVTTFPDGTRVYAKDGNALGIKTTPRSRSVEITGKVTGADGSQRTVSQRFGLDKKLQEGVIAILASRSDLLDAAWLADTDSAWRMVMMLSMVQQAGSWQRDDFVGFKGRDREILEHMRDYGWNAQRMVEEFPFLDFAMGRPISKPRQDSGRPSTSLSGDYFGLNPNPFDKPLWRAMGIA